MDLYRHDDDTGIAEPGTSPGEREIIERRIREQEKERKQWEARHPGEDWYDASFGE